MILSLASWLWWRKLYFQFTLGHCSVKNLLMIKLIRDRLRTIRKSSRHILSWCKRVSFGTYVTNQLSRQFNVLAFLWITNSHYIYMYVDVYKRNILSIIFGCEGFSVCVSITLVARTWGNLRIINFSGEDFFFIMLHAIRVILIFWRFEFSTTYLAKWFHFAEKKSIKIS